MLKKIMLAALIGTSFASIPLVSTARTIVITQAPPAPVSEAQPNLRPGQAWMPGHYVYRNGNYVWVRGQVVRERRGQHYVADRWVERNGRWYQEAGRWQRGDRDGDGVPNRFDNKPNNPNRS